jgi:hypothetical protein
MKGTVCGKWDMVNEETNSDVDCSQRAKASDTQLWAILDNTCGETSDLVCNVAPTGQVH